MRICFAVSLLLLLSTPQTAYAPLKKDQITFGSEWTFTNWQIWLGNTNRSKEKFIKKLRSEIISRCAQSKRCVFRGDTLRLSGGHTIKIDIDPGVLELNLSPMTNSAFDRKRVNIQNHVFDAASAVRLHPHPFKGGGHIHFGAYHVIKHPLLFRNYVVDFYNHVFTQAWGFVDYDNVNAKPLFTYPKKLQDAYLRIIADFDKKDPKKLTIKDSLKLAYDIFNTVHKDYKKLIKTKYVPLNLRNLSDFYEALSSYSDFTEAQLKREKIALGNNSRVFNAWEYLTKHLTIEIRSIRAQKNATEYLLQTQLIESRLLKISELETPIATKPFKNKSARAIRKEFKQYVEDSGLDWRDYEHFLKNVSFRLKLICSMIGEGLTYPFSQSK